MLSAEILPTLLTSDDPLKWLSDKGIALQAVLDTARAYVERDLLIAAQLAQFVIDHAPPTLVPHAHYLHAQTLAMRGSFAEAATEIALAAAGFEQQGDQMAAWRTIVGRMQLLAQSGDFANAIALGHETLLQLPANADELRGVLFINLANCHYYQGEYDNALDVLARAEAETSDFPRSAIIANRGNVLTAIGRFSAATTLLTSILSDRPDEPLWQARQHLNLGHLYQQTGAYQTSLQHLQTARDLLPQDNPVTDTGIAWLDSGNTYLALNLLDEAQAAYERATAILTDMPYEQAQIALGLGGIAARRGATAQAITQFDTAITHAVAVGNSDLQAIALTELAALQSDTARETITRAVDLAQSPPTRFFALLRSADLHLTANNLSFADSALSTASQTLPTLPPQLQALHNQRRGQLAARRGEGAAAERYFQAAIAIVEQLRGTLQQEAVRTSFLQDKIGVYADLIALYLETDRAADAFAVAEAAKSRTLADMMVGAVDERLSLTDAEIARLQSLRGDLNALYNLLLDSSTRSGSLDQQQSRIASLEREMTALQQREQLRAPTVTSSADFDLPLIVYHALGDELFAFVCSGEEITVVRNLARLSDVRGLVDKLYSQWNRLRVGRSFVAPHLERLERTAQRVLNALYNQIFAPLEAYLPHGEIVIVPHSVLHQVPFSALYDGSTYLLDRYIFSTAPSATVYSLCQRRERAMFARGQLFGSSAVGLTAVSAELSAIADILPAADIFLDEQATRECVESADADVLHIATHGIFRADNPRFSALKLHDGWLTALDIAQHDRLPAHVTLSACESGRTHVAAGDEVMGLPRAFLAGGTASLLVTLWRVQDDISAEIMPQWYAAVRGGRDSATALHAAQCAIRADHPHPYYWSPFILIGKRA